LTIYAPSVTTRVGNVGSALFSQGFVTRTIVVTLQGPHLLRTQVLSQFRPAGANSRSNYATTQQLHERPAGRRTGAARREGKQEPCLPAGGRMVRSIGGVVLRTDLVAFSLGPSAAQGPRPVVPTTVRTRLHAARDARHLGDASAADGLHQPHVLAPIGPFGPLMPA
jgi:hypothetical protein